MKLRQPLEINRLGTVTRNISKRLPRSVKLMSTAVSNDKTGTKVMKNANQNKQLECGTRKSQRLMNRSKSTMIYSTAEKNRGPIDRKDSSVKSAKQFERPRNVSLPRQKSNLKKKGRKSNSQLLQSSAIKNGHNSKQLKYLAKEEQSELQIYTCFICFKRGVGKCMWEYQEPYISHMDIDHQIKLDFSQLLRDKTDKPLPCSHFYFKKVLTNLLRNTQIGYLKQILYRYSQQRYDQLYYARYQESKETIFYRSIDFLSYIVRTGRTNEKRLSHVFKQINGMVILQRNPLFQLTEATRGDYFNDRINFIKRKWTSCIKKFCLKNMLTLYPRGNLLELISCNVKLQQEISIQELYAPLTYCKQCKIYISNRNLYDAHFVKMHPKKTREYRYDISEEKFLDHGLVLSKDKPHKIIKEITQNQNMILGGQISMMEEAKAENEKHNLMICGDCLQIFRNGVSEYAQHIYQNHTALHPGNTHNFCFLIPPNQLQEKECDL